MAVGWERRAQVTVTKEMELPGLGDQLLIFGCGSPVAWMTELAWALANSCAHRAAGREREETRSLGGLQAYNELSSRHATSWFSAGPASRCIMSF